MEISLPLHELEFSYARSSGPGGQNVNKTSTKAILRWNVAASPSIPDAVRARFLARYGARVSADGWVVIASDRFRDQPRNREDCVERLRQWLHAVARPPKPRKKTKPTRTSRERRLASKGRHSEKKRARGRVPY